MVVTGEASIVEELRIFNGNLKDVYVKAKLSIGDKFIHVQAGDITVIYPTCNVTKMIIGTQKNSK